LFEYEPFGGLAKTVDPNQNVIRVEYDNLGRKTALRDPNLGHIEYVVDPLGRPGKTTQSLTDGTYAETPGYDTWGRLISQRNDDPAKVFDTRYSNAGYVSSPAWS